jgi:hypothetical protein
MTETVSEVTRDHRAITNAPGWGRYAHIPGTPIGRKPALAAISSSTGISEEGVDKSSIPPSTPAVLPNKKRGVRNPHRFSWRD